MLRKLLTLLNKCELKYSVLHWHSSAGYHHTIKDLRLAKRDQNARTVFVSIVGRLTINISQSVWIGNCLSAWKGNCLSSIPGVVRGWGGVGDMNNQHFTVHMNSQLSNNMNRQLPIVDPEGLTINIERINIQHFSVCMNCQSVFIDPGGGAENYAALLSPCEVRGCN